MEFGEWLLARESHINTSPHIDLCSANEEFATWFTTNGGHLHPSIELDSSPDHGHCLRVKTSHELSVDDTIVSCPHNLALSWPSARKIHYPDVKLPAVPQHVATRFFLMKQKLWKEASPWWPYIRMLPETFNTPIYYSPEDLNWIRGTNLGRAREVRDETWRREYDQAVQVLFPSASTEDLKKVWTWELYVWASTVMSSRCFPGPAAFNQPDAHDPTYNDDPEGKAPVLIPGLDLLNHDPCSKVAWMWDIHSYILKTDERLEGGAEVFNNYGPKSNEALIMGYGFTIPDNPADHFNIGFAPAIASYIETTKTERLENSPKAAKNDSLPQKPTMSSPRIKAQYIHVHYVYMEDNAPVFSPDFLSNLSIAIENRRERHHANTTSLAPTSETTLIDFPMTRKQLHVLSTIYMILQRDRNSITKYDSDLSPTPQNVRQIDASRYRGGQLSILNGVLSYISNTLTTLIDSSSDSLNQDTYQILRLEDTFSLTPHPLLRDYRQILHTGMKTRDPDKIRERGGTDFAFGIWLCGIWILYERYHNLASQGSGSDSDGDDADVEDLPLPPLFLTWCIFLHTTYPFPRPPPSSESDITTPLDSSNSTEHTSWRDPVRYPPPSEPIAKDPSHNSSTIEEISSYLEAIRSTMAKHPESLYKLESVDAERLRWCLDVVREEGVWIPDLWDQEGDGDGDDEWVLFVGGANGGEAAR